MNTNKNALKTLTEAVDKFIHDMDEVMNEDVSSERGGKIARLVGILEVMNTVAKREVSRSETPKSENVQGAAITCNFKS